MRFRRSKAIEAVRDKDRPPVTFSGFAEPVPYLYEFRTSEGERIYLHEMDCPSIHFNPMSRRLVLAFECIASETMHYPLTLSLTFEEAQIVEWSDDASDPATLTASGAPERIRGQVSDLSYNENGTFSLELLHDSVTFEAASVMCQILPGTSSPDPVPSTG